MTRLLGLAIISLWLMAVIVSGLVVRWIWAMEFNFTEGQDV